MLRWWHWWLKTTDEGVSAARWSGWTAGISPYLWARWSHCLLMICSCSKISLDCQSFITVKHSQQISSVMGSYTERVSKSQEPFNFAFVGIIIWQWTMENINMTDCLVFLKSDGSGDKLILALGVTALGTIRDCRPGLDMGYLQKSKSIFKVCFPFSSYIFPHKTWTRKHLCLCLFSPSGCCLAQLFMSTSPSRVMWGGVPTTRCGIFPQCQEKRQEYHNIAE